MTKICCILCGRDTGYKDGICIKCKGAGYGDGTEQKGRSQRDLNVLGGEPELADIEPDSYHGDSCRDDI